MRTPLLALVALLALAAAPQKQGARDWTTVATKTPAGAYVIGNPRASVKLIEYASYTCPHCAHFAAESAPVLKDRLIRSGSTSLEFRHYIFNGLDLGAAVLARCTGPRRFAATTAYIYATQDQWLARGQAFQQANGAMIAAYPELAQIRALVDGAGLTRMIVARGLPAKAVNACFADQAEIDRITAMTAAVPAGVDSTPSFFVNGQLVSHVGWAGLEPHLRAAGAR